MKRDVHVLLMVSYQISVSNSINCKFTWWWGEERRYKGFFGFLQESYNSLVQGILVLVQPSIDVVIDLQVGLTFRMQEIIILPTKLIFWFTSILFQCGKFICDLTVKQISVDKNIQNKDACTQNHFCSMNQPEYFVIKRMNFHILMARFIITCIPVRGF